MPTRPPVHRPPRLAVPVHRPPQTIRPTAAQRGYGGAWQRARAGFLAAHPVCATVGCGGSSTDVDHIVPHRGDRGRFWDRGNWQALCHACHSAKTAREDGGFGRRSGAGRREG